MSEAFSRGLGVLLIVVVFSVLLKNLGWKGAPVLISVGLLGVISIYAESIREVIDITEALVEYADVEVYLKAFLKIFSVCFLSLAVSDALCELGESGAAKGVGIIAKAEILTVSAPFIKEIIESALELVS